MAISPLLQTRLNTHGIRVGMPGWTIIENARFLPPVPGSAAPIGDAPPQALRKLMGSFYQYGRAHWTWSQSSPVTAANGGLVKGLTQSCACAAFNLNFKWLAENILGIQGITQGQETSQFLTQPGSVCIDSKWPGNVCSQKETFNQLKAFKFQGHWWVQHGGINYDVCYNKTFGNSQQIIWTHLDTDARMAGQCHLDPKHLYKLRKPLPYAQYLIMMQKNGTNNWPSWQLVSQDQLKVLKR